MKTLHLYLTTLASTSLALTLPYSTSSPASSSNINNLITSRQDTPKTCTSPKKRKNWADATDTEKQAYIDAVLCLATKPSRLDVPTHSSLYDDFGYVYAKLSTPQRSE